MSKISRNHHYIPQVYLKGFTEIGTKGSRLSVFKTQDLEFFYTIPRNVGAKRDFNLLTLEGIPSDKLEKKLSELLESYCNKAIKDVEKTNEFRGDNRKHILNLIALIAIRNPSNREYWDEWEAYVAKAVLSTISKSEIGSTKNGMIVTQELKDFLEHGQYNIKFPIDWQIKREICTLDNVINLLLQRKWTLASAPSGSCFITCDRPVLLTSIEPNDPIYSSGFGLKNRQVFFPLSKKTALIGDLEGKDESITASREMVAGINSNLLMAAKSQVYAPHDNFYFKDYHEKVACGLDALINFFKN